MSQIDLVPTFLDAMGRDIPESLPGKSLLPHLDRDEAGNVFVEWHPGKNIDGMMDRCPEGYSEEQCTLAALQRIRAVITPDGWKLCQSVEDADRSQLFDLATDMQKSDRFCL